MKKLLLIALLIVGTFAQDKNSLEIKFDPITGALIKSDSSLIKVFKDEQANQNKLLRLKNISTEYIINPGDPILIKRKRGFGKSHLGGKYINIEKNYLLIDTSTGIKNKIEKVFINNIHSIYIGNIKSYAALYKKWSIYFAVLAAPMSIQMTNNNKHTIIFSKEFNTILNFVFNNILLAVTYTPLVSYIDFNIKKSSAREFIIDLNHWEIITK